MDSIYNQSTTNARWVGQAALMAPIVPVIFVQSPRPQAGFPSPATDYAEDTIDLNKLLVTNPPATFFVRVDGDSLSGLNIVHRDLVSVDRSLTPVQGDVVVAVFQGDIYIKVFDRISARIALTSRHATADLYPPLYLDQDDEALIWGVVTGVVRGVRRAL